ncbi:ankyrin [Lindgomyces ingoldianus]|uniref:Ankyrin n=1 Tax=Lindgomyces ingoldianus TaxID=673940 RepID=A0ACB6QN77_9PLEO|nr:ankyrin [Lindgomyces ingoldianus]KAF2468345.1 ankyrin [Lindgomyces ingoldianus]
MEVMPDIGWEQDAVLLGADDVSDFNEDNVLPQSPENIAKIRTWLQPTSYDDSDSEYKKHLSSHLAGTGAWLLSSLTYEEWHSSQDMSILWIRGVPGSGKSVMAATLADWLSQEKVPVLYFFFRQIIDANHTPLSAVRDWLCQILAYSPPLQAALLEYVKTSRSLESVSTADFWGLLRMSMLYLPRVYCVVDALDELNQGPEMISFLHSLADLGAWRPSKVKLILTSRPVHSVEIHLRQVKLLHIRLDEAKVDIDIATYVQRQLDESSIPSEHHAAIKEAIPGRANGLFLYARLAMDEFLEPGANPEEVLSNLPADLNVMYTDLLREHCKRANVPHDVQLLILQWVTHATRPLRLLELAGSINITHFPEGQRNLKAAKDLARSACGPLVEILPDETLSVVHHSLTEFLNGSTRTAKVEDFPILEYGPTHNHLAIVCLAHLQSGSIDDVVFSSYPYDDRGQLERHYILPPFAKYATMNWFVHARKAALAGVDQAEVNEILDDLWRGERFQTWSALARVGCRNVTPLFAAVSLGLALYTETLLLRPGTNPNRGKMKEPPLYCAAEKGYDDIIELLLHHGADFNEGNKDGYRALHAAAQNNQAGAVTMLLRAGADPFCPPGKADGFYDYGLEPNGTPITKACRNGHFEAMAAILPFIHTSDQVHEALEEAVNWKRAAIVELLLKHPEVKVDAIRKNHRLLYTACACRNPKIIKLLLHAGANPNIVYHDSRRREVSDILNESDFEPTISTKPSTERGYTALFALASGGDSLLTVAHASRFKLLLHAGANVNQVDSKGNTALAYTYDVLAMRCLLDAGTDPTVANDASETLLHGHTKMDILRLVLEETNLDVNIRTNEEGYTPLLKTLSHTYAESTAAEKALLLLEFGADASAVDNKGNSAFHLASATRFPSEGDAGGRLIKALRASGGNGNFANAAGDTPLHTMEYQGFQDDIFSALIDAGLDTEARDREGRTPLFKAVTVLQNDHNCKKVFDKMVKSGCRFDILDKRGRNLLFLVTADDRYKLFQHLIELGLSPTHTDYDGNTLWHVTVCCEYHFHLRVDMADLGVDPEQPNLRGRTPLHIICSRSQVPAIFDKFLPLVHNWNAADEDGVTALHITSTFCAYKTKKLLRAGADWMQTTRDGSTVFHIAAKSRQANILGVLLKFIDRNGDKTDIPTLMNKKDILGRTPLWYACASGRIETVKMLIDAGATVKSDSYDGSSWQGCVEFEGEQAIWAIRARTQDRDYSQSHAGSTLISDKTRPKIERAKGRLRPPFDPALKHRIDEIVDILATHESDARRHLPYAISSAADNGCAYTIDCLLHASKSLLAVMDSDPFHFSMRVKSLSLDSNVLSCLEKRQAAREEVFRSSNNAQDTRAIFERLLGLREYQIAAQTLLESDCLKPDRYGRTILHGLVQDGYASILAQVCNLDMANKLEDFEWCDQQETASKAIKGSIQPLLLDAVQSELPNMDVLRVLVENIGVNVNTQTSYRKYMSRPPPLDYETFRDKGVLHLIFSPSMTWWQVSQALPYLVEKGADLNLRDRSGKTPLHAALEMTPNPDYDIETIKLLVRLGADVNAIDNEGLSCLGQSLDHIPTAEFLIQKGARIRYADLLRAIEKSNCMALELLLQAGGNPNERDFEDGGWNKPENPQYKPCRKDGAFYLLDYAACDRTRGATIDKKSREKIVDLLVRYGADINARYEDTTLMHRLIRSSNVVRPLLKHPSLDANLVDLEGRTILHTACGVERRRENSAENDPSYVEILLERGADVTTRDSKGMNTLHYLFHGIGRRIAIPDPRAVSAVLKGAPELINQVDDEGNTPLHKACEASIDHVGELLSMGADPLAVNAKGATPLHYLLCEKWNAALGVKIEGPLYELFLRFLTMGANINARDHHGETPIFHYCRRAFGVNFTPKSEVPKGLYYYSPIWEMPLFEFFDQAGVDWKVLNNDGETLMHIVAAGRGCSVIGTSVQRFKFLVDKGLNVMAEDKRQQTPLDLAAASNEEGILALFSQGERSL